MGRVRHVLLLVALGLSVADVGVFTTSSSAQVSPTLTVAPPAARVGSAVIVSARNFPPLIQNLQVAVCGNQAAGGSADCDEAGARNFATGTGNFQINLIVSLPPAPCPCAIQANAPSMGVQVTVPFTVIGAPVAPVVRAPQLQANVVITQARLVGSNSWAAWFGAAPKRTLLLTVSNRGSVAAVSPPLVLQLGKGPTPSDNVASPDLGTLPPGASRTYQIPVDFPVLSYGSYMLGGQLGPAGLGAGFTTRMSSWPWGLIALAIVLIQLTLLWIRNRIRDFVWMRELRESMATIPVTQGSAPDEVGDVSRTSDLSSSGPQGESRDGEVRVASAPEPGGKSGSGTGNPGGLT